MVTLKSNRNSAGFKHGGVRRRTNERDGDGGTEQSFNKVQTKGLHKVAAVLRRTSSGGDGGNRGGGRGAKGRK